MLKKLLIIISISIFLFGCSTNVATNDQTENDPPDGDAVVENANNETQANTDKTNSNLPSEKTLDLQANHPNGTVLRLTKVQYNEDSISLDFSVTNGHQYDIKLAQGGMQLKDSAGNQYNVSPPQGNPDLEITPGSNVKGTLTFLGRISPDANSVSLITNSRYSNRSSESARTPTMTIDNIPVER